MAAATDQWITREQLLDRYDIQESTLSGAEDSDLLSVVEVGKNGRGHLTYRITERTDLLFRVLRVFPFEISNAKARLVPMHRALLFYGIRDGIQDAIGILKRRSILNYPKKEILKRWNLFLRRVPKEAIPFVTQKTDERNEAVELVLEILEIREAFEDPEIMLANAIFNDFHIRAMTESLIQVGASSAQVSQLLSDLKRLEIQTEHVKQYKHFYYDPYLLTPVDVKNYCDKTGVIKGYTDVLKDALDYRDEVYGFIGAMGWAAEVEYEEEFRALLRNERKILSQPHVGKESDKRYHNSLNRAIKLAESMHSYRKDTGDEYEEDDDMLNLKHDVSLNEDQLTIDDIDAEDLDEFETGSKEQTSGTSA